MNFYKTHTYKTELYEKVDFDKLELLISAKDLNENLRQMLKLYNKKRNGEYIPVKYYHSKSLTDMGRLYAEKGLGLQSFKREIRHALAKDFYYDIDMVNAQPYLIFQYCKKHDIECEQLENYVNNRNDILNKIQKFHNVNRDQAKNLMLRLCNLGNYVIEKYNYESGMDEIYEPKKKINFVTKFQNEFKEIAKSICDIEKNTFESVLNNEKKLNKKATTISITAQVLEYKCMMAMYDFFTNQKYTVGVLCFDGIMVEKNDYSEKKLEQVLKACEKYVKTKTKYNVQLAIKPMDTPLSIELPKYTEFVTSDLEAQQKLFKIEGQNKFRYSEGQLYIFNENTGMYETDIKTLFYYLVKNKNYLKIQVTQKRTDSYGESTTLMKRIIPAVQTAAKQYCDDEWLKKTENSSLGYLLFKNGIYNMKTGAFSVEFNPDIVFHARVPWDFPERNEHEIEYAYKISFGQLFKNPKPMIAALARAIAGDKTKNFYFCPGYSNAGKSHFCTMLFNAFGNYISTFNAEELAVKSSYDSRDEGAKLRWSFLIRFSRIILSNEMNMNKKIDGNCIKKQSGGDKLQGRTHGGEETDFRPHYTIFCLLNDIPKIKPLDKGVEKRLQYLEFSYVFVDPGKLHKKSFYKERDLDLENKIASMDFIRGFIHIILDGYKKFLIKGMPHFDQEIKNNWIIDNRQTNEIIDEIKEYFEITNDPNDSVTVQEFKKFRSKNKKLFQTISQTRFNEILRNDLGLVEGRSSFSRFWKGIRYLDRFNFKD